MKISKIASREVPNAETLAAYVDSVRLMTAGSEITLEKSLDRMVKNMPSRHQILRAMDDADRTILYDSVRYVWKKVTGHDIPDSAPTDTEKDTFMDGCYWLLPGGIEVHGLNHYSAAKNHRGVVCSLLDINPLVFEYKLNQNPDELIALVAYMGGVRMIVKRSTNSVFMQTTESSWPWARDKIKKMYHTNKVVKVLDPSQPYLGWKSGVPIILH